LPTDALARHAALADRAGAIAAHDTIIQGAGNYAVCAASGAIANFALNSRRPGSMGCNLPAAVAAKQLHRNTVIAFAGDGCVCRDGFRPRSKRCRRL
jgi:thiamine pyrophosphate-dependent acetolactate synthase large subunit-like protein